VSRAALAEALAAVLLPAAGAWSSAASLVAEPVAEGCPVADGAAALVVAVESGWLVAFELSEPEPAPVGVQAPSNSSQAVATQAPATRVASAAILRGRRLIVSS